MTAQQKLHKHLQELERGEAFSHERLQAMTALIDSITSPLPVMRIEDAELCQGEWYHIKSTIGAWDWYYQYDANEDDFKCPFGDDAIPECVVTHVVVCDSLSPFLNASIQEES